MRNPSKVIFNAVAVSGTSAYYSDWLEVDQLSYGMLHINWTGTPTGAIVYHGSNDPAIETERERLRGQAPATQGSGSGSAASTGAVVAGVATLSGLTGMSAERVGDSLTISGAATGANNGTFEIVEYVSATSVKVSNAAAVTPDANDGSLAWVVVPRSNQGQLTVKGANSAAKYIILNPAATPACIAVQGSDPAGSASNQIAWFPSGKLKYVRVKYTNASGTGTLNGWSNA